jgi:GAF domain-containing protein
MSIQIASRLSTQYYSELAQSLLGSPEVGARAGLLANALRQALPETGCAVYRFVTTADSASWELLGVSDEMTVSDQALPADTALFVPLISSMQPVVYSAVQLSREDYRHLQVVRTVRSIGYLPLVRDGVMMGAFEIVSFANELTTATLQSLEGLTEVAAMALSSADEYEEQRQNLLDSIHRLTQLYDLEKSLNATLDFEPLLQLIPAKVAAMLPCQALHLWMFDGGTLRLVSTWGEDPTSQVGTTEEAGGGYVGDMAEKGAPLLINDFHDERLAARNARGGTGHRITNALLAPLIEQGMEGSGDGELGVLEALNKAGGKPFDEDDLFFMTTISETVASALKNASLMYAEKKLEILQALVEVSSEITSTLRLDRLLQIIVNNPQTVLPFERCSIALDNRGRLQLKAISGQESIPVGDTQVDQLRTLLAQLSKYDEQLLVRQYGETLDAEEPRVQAAIEKHFEASGYRALYALPLTDDQGRVGLLLYESSDPGFLDQAHIEMIKVLAGQTTVAIRNALLYREVPLLRLLEPVFQRKRAFLRSERKRQATILGSIAAAIVLLIFCPLSLRIGGPATVAPQSTATVTAPVDGTIAQVYAREGQRVRRGDVLAHMDDRPWRDQLAASQAKYDEARLATEHGGGRHSSQPDRTLIDYLRAEVEQAQLRIGNAQLRSPIDGVVMTPNLENATGEHLDAGNEFAKVLNLHSARLNIAVDQQDARLVKAGQMAAIKLDSFPAQTLHGRVVSLSPEAQVEGDRRVFYAHVLLPNEGAELRTGMEGRAKISAGYHPAGYVLFRAPALWLWGKLWDWIGW